MSPLILAGVENGSPLARAGTLDFTQGAVMAAIAESVPASETALPVCLWKENPNRLVSLWDLLKFHAHILVERMMALATIQIISDNGDTDTQEEIIEDLRKIRETCSGLGLIGCVEKATRAMDYTRDHFDKPDGVSALANDLSTDIQRALAKRWFLYIQESRAPFVDNPNLLGDAVAQIFPSALWDIEEAGNCLVAECHTAAVFHFMRVAEHGLRRLARRLHVKLTHKGTDHPIEFADWGKVITGVKNELARIANLSPGPKKQTKLERYSDAADHCTFMKDIWRNNLSHARKPYASTEAILVMERVQAFMVFLAKTFLARTA
jgi:hypothetical protein